MTDVQQTQEWKVEQHGQKNWERKTGKSENNRDDQIPRWKTIAKLITKYRENK